MVYMYECAVPWLLCSSFVLKKKKKKPKPKPKNSLSCFFYTISHEFLGQMKLGEKRGKTDGGFLINYNVHLSCPRENWGCFFVDAHVF